MKNSGGSAIHINDGNIAEDANGNEINSMEHPDYGVTTCNPSLTIDFTTTTIENMVSGLLTREVFPPSAHRGRSDIRTRTAGCHSTSAQ